MESGRRWRFRAGETWVLGQRSMGDGALGYAFDQAFSLAEARLDRVLANANPKKKSSTT